jgi:exodeoxyribonuclease V alpha subunit
MSCWGDGVAEAASAQFESHFLRMVSRQTGALEPDVRQVLRQLLQATITQHSCLPVASLDPTLIQKLRDHPIVGTELIKKPIILHHDKLYLAKFFEVEKEVAERISAKNHAQPVADIQRLAVQLDARFGDEPGNQQKLAALLATTRNLAIITGGPGTGKTSTVVKILSILLENQPGLEIRLAAPTGKAAMRLAESLRSSDFAQGNGGSQMKDMDVVTLHRLLGMRRDGRSWRHGEDNPIQAEVLVVDEASMIDLFMMHRLLRALHPDTRLILLGDPNQLPSVETGNVLADLCAGNSAGDGGFSPAFSTMAEPIVGPVTTSQSTHNLTDSLCELKKSYRFEPDSGIGQLASQIQQGESRLQASSDGSVQMELDPEMTGSSFLAYWKHYTQLLSEGETNDLVLLHAFDETRVLCSHRAGADGVISVNSMIEATLEQLQLKKKDEAFYPGRPILITHNDYNLGLFNGDIGVCVPHTQPDQYLVVFPGGKYLASRLPEHETCFAMTVHKSQGSEFEQVVLLLSDEATEDAENLITKELLYTAVTRAKKSITLLSSESRWQSAVNRSSARVSGMASFLGIDRKR